MKVLSASKPKLDILQQVRIASPCLMSWEKMAGDDRVRHCGECNLNVYNFSAMTRSEVEALLQKREGRICGRFFRRVDGSIMTKDCPRGVRAATRRLLRVASAALAALMSVSAAWAQAHGRRDVKTVAQESSNRKGSAYITVTDMQGAPVAKAKVTLVREADHKMIERMTDSLGHVTLPVLEEGRYIATITMSGFSGGQHALLLRPHERVNAQVTLRIVPLMGDVVMIEDESSPLDTNSGTLHTDFDTHAIENIP